MHPFTSLALWLWFSVTASVLPPPWLWGWSLLPLLALMVLPGARSRVKLVLAVMLPLGLGLYLVHGPWLRILLDMPEAPVSETFPILPLWCRLLACLASAQLWLWAVSTERFVHALFASRLPIALVGPAARDHSAALAAGRAGVERTGHPQHGAGSAGFSQPADPHPRGRDPAAAP